MFAYRDDRKDIFYFKIYEVIQVNPGLSRCSSVSSSAFDLSFEDTKQRPDDRIELKVYGISEVGPNIKNDLVSVLLKRLNEKVLLAQCDQIGRLLYKEVQTPLTP